MEYDKLGIWLSQVILGLRPESRKGIRLLEIWTRDGGDPQKADQWFTDPEMNLFGIASPDVPGFAIESQPGDVIFFSHQVWHGSFGDQSGRRMFSINFRVPPGER